MRAALAAGGVRAEPWLSRGPGDLAQQVEAAVRGGCDTVLIAGGDGTVYEAVNAILGAGGDVRLGVIPLGTGNDFLKAVGFGSDWREACGRIAGAIREDRTRRVDVGRCNGHYFVNVMGIGLDGEVTLRANRIRWLPGAAVYLVALVQALVPGVRTPRVRVRRDGGTLEQPVTLVAVCNGHTFGGIFRVAPTAVIDDGRLDLVIADALDRRGVLRFVPRAIAGTHLGMPGITHLTVRRVSIEAEQPMPLQADGEIIDPAATRVDIEILPGRLRLLC